MTDAGDTKSGSISDRQWQKWGETNPYQGVLGVETKSIADPEVRRKFFESGDADVSLVLEAIERRAPDFVAAGGKVLDFGCGVGRLMAAFARRGFHVTGVDVSPAMVAEATKNLSEFNGRFGFISLDDAQIEGFDIVHSHIVIQHIRPEQGMPIIRRLMQQVRPNGFLAIQFTLGSPDWKRTTLNWFRYRIPPLHMAFNVIRGRPLTEPIMELNTYDIHAILGLSAENGIRDVTIFQHGGATYRGVMIIGRKSEPQEASL